MDIIGNKFRPGAHYGPILSQTDLYLLKAELDLNPILSNTSPGFHLIFNIANGQTGGFNPGAQQDRELSFTAKDEFATVPRVSQLILITRLSPWCTIVKNENGVTLGDICSTIWKDYSENSITEQEFNSLPPRMQEAVKRASANNLAATQPAAAHWPYSYSPAQSGQARYKRYDWLRDKVYLERLARQDDYAQTRLGFKAPNIFVMEFVA